MLNIIDITLVVLILFYLLKNAGGVLRTIKNILFVILFLIFFGIVVQLLLDASVVSGAAREAMGNSYFTKLSVNIIKWIYPAVEKSAPGIDTFIKEKILSAPTPEVSVPKVIIPEKAFPKLTIPENLELK